jgi:hypothetical protein
MHNLAIDQNLISSHPVPLAVCRIRTGRDLDLTPLAVRRHELSGSRSLLELGIHSLVFNAALPLDERRIYFECQWFISLFKALGIANCQATGLEDVPKAGVMRRSPMELLKSTRDRRSELRWSTGGL